AARPVLPEVEQLLDRVGRAVDLQHGRPVGVEAGQPAAAARDGLDRPLGPGSVGHCSSFLSKELPRAGLFAAAPAHLPFLPASLPATPLWLTPCCPPRCRGGRPPPGLCVAAVRRGKAAGCQRATVTSDDTVIIRHIQ